MLTSSAVADPFAEADEETGETKQSQNYIHIRIQRTLLSSSHRRPRQTVALLAIQPALTSASWLINMTHTTERNGRKTLTTVQGLPKKFDQKKILKVIKKKFGRTIPAPLSTHQIIILLHVTKTRH